MAVDFSHHTHVRAMSACARYAVAYYADMRLRAWMDSLPRGELSRIARERGVRPADFYEAADPTNPRRPKTLERAKRIAEATGGAVTAIEILEDTAA